MRDEDKHRVEVEISELGDTPVHPPRRRLWDFVPNRLAMFIVNTLKYNPPPTPYELWLLKSIYLRGYYNRFYGAINLLNQQSALAALDSFGNALGNAPGSSELN